MSAPPGTLARRAETLDGLANSITADNVEATLQQGTVALGELGGDPAVLDDMSMAFDRAARDIGAVGEETVQATVSRVRAAWAGEAGQGAATAIATEGREVGDDVAPFSEAARVLTDLAGRLRDAQREHLDLRQYLFDLGHQAAQAGSIAQLDPAAMGDVTDRAAAALRSCAALLTAVQQDHDAAAERFNSLAEQDSDHRSEMPAPVPGRVPAGQSGIEGHWWGTRLRYNKNDTEDLGGLLAGAAGVGGGLGFIPGLQPLGAVIGVPSSLLAAGVQAAKTDEGIDMYLLGGVIPVWVDGR